MSEGDSLSHSEGVFRKVSGERFGSGLHGRGWMVTPGCPEWVSSVSDVYTSTESRRGNKLSEFVYGILG